MTNQSIFVEKPRTFCFFVFFYRFICYFIPFPFLSTFKMSTGDYRVADISLADFGRKEIDLAEHEV